jgi:hypothetical protein
VPQVLALLRERELGFVPLEQFRVERCCVELAALHPAVAARLPEVLLAAAHALSNAYQAAAGRGGGGGGGGAQSSEVARRLHEQVGAVTAFAGSCRMRIPARAFARLCTRWLRSGLFSTLTKRVRAASDGLSLTDTGPVRGVGVRTLTDVCRA